MKRERADYSEFVKHPRYGRSPNFTGLNPISDGSKVSVHWHSPKDSRIPDTAIKADLRRQKFYTFPVTHYFDVKRVCRDCKRPFIFFAEEQKHWYETLGFGLDSDCVRCPVCRKKDQGIARLRERYAELVHLPNPSIEQLIKMADCCLELIAKRAFTSKQFQRVRRILNCIPESHRSNSSYLDLRSRLRELEKKAAAEPRNR